MPAPDSGSNAPGRDVQLAQLLTDLAEQVRHGGCADIDGAARQHPDLAKELRQLWAAIQISEALGHSARLTSPTVAPSPISPVAATDTNLPRRFGDYQLLEEIGRGAMGVVYMARQQSLDRTVAIKMLLRGAMATTADLARFRAEAETAAKLQHRSVVPVYEVGDCEGQAYFSMRYVEGTTLAKLVAAGPLPPRESARYMAAICRAIHHAHQQGILHRDLKPSNVLIDRAGEAHVSDFGLAKRIPAVNGVESRNGLTISGAIVGTPCYMSPEQASGRRGVLSPASDIYSLGAILYELLTGRPPFQAATPLDILLLVLEQDPILPRLLNRKVDLDLEMICLKCLQKPADLRYGSAAAMAEDLEAYLKGEPISARSSGLVYTISKILSETHHVSVLENWGLLWIWHSLALLSLCSVTNCLYLWQVDNVAAYLALWGIGLGTWASIFWALRRRGGPVTFVERQIAHVWAGSTIGSIGLFLVEMLLKLPVLTLSPVLAVMAGMAFLVKAATLSGSFYIYAVASFITALLMAYYPPTGLFLFGIVSAAGFFIPGLKYYLQSGRQNPPAG